MWDPEQYARFSAERSRPFYDLFDRLGNLTVTSAVDLGCGGGELTRLFLKRWRGARVVGLDSSAEMLAQAALYAVPGQLTFEQGAIEHWQPEAPVDLLFSNAALQWVPDHPTLIPRLAQTVARKGVLAVQMPDNFDAPSHRAIGEVASDPAWRDHLGGLGRRPGIQPLVWYVQTLLGLGFKVDAWATEYYHVLAGENAALEWVKGTALRPHLARLPTPELQQAFLEAVGEKLRKAYPAGEGGTLFPFRRIFFIATRV